MSGKKNDICECLGKKLCFRTTFYVYEYEKKKKNFQQKQ